MWRHPRLPIHLSLFPSFNDDKSYVPLNGSLTIDILILGKLFSEWVSYFTMLVPEHGIIFRPESQMYRGRCLSSL